MKKNSQTLQACKNTINLGQVWSRTFVKVVERAIPGICLYRSILTNITRQIKSCSNVPVAINHFLVSSALSSHNARCHRDRGLTRKHLCDFCGKEFFRAYYLKIHIRSHHTDEKPYVCNICDKHFPGMLNLKKHEQYYHKPKLVRTKNGLGPHICLTCGKEYAYAYYLKVHNRSVHFGEKPYICSYCEKRVFYKACTWGTFAGAH